MCWTGARTNSGNLCRQREEQRLLSLVKRNKNGINLKRLYELLFHQPSHRVPISPHQHSHRRARPYPGQPLVFFDAQHCSLLDLVRDISIALYPTATIGEHLGKCKSVWALSVLLSTASPPRRAQGTAARG